MPDGFSQGRSLLEVIDLYTHFYTPMGIARAVDGVSFKLEYGISLGIVGESGSGKSVLSRTIIDILAKNGSVKSKGKIYFEGRDLRSLTDKEMQEVRGRDIAMVFQNPMSSLNPVKKLGKQITEVLRSWYSRPGKTIRPISYASIWRHAPKDRDCNCIGR